MRRENVLRVWQNRTIDYVKKTGWNVFSHCKWWNTGVKTLGMRQPENKSFCISRSPPPEGVHMRLKLKMHQSHNKDKLYYLQNNTWKHSTHITSEHLEWEWKNHAARVLSWWKEFSGQLLAEFQQHILSGCWVCYCVRDFSIYHLCSTHTSGWQSGWLVVVAQCS